MDIVKNIETVKLRIAKALEKRGANQGEVRLVAVTKTVSPETIRTVYQQGIRFFGESYAQEMVSKITALSNLDIEWHFLGHLQKNKVKYVVPHVKMIHSLDSIELAEIISKRATRQIGCLVEINLAGEKSKTGIEEGQSFELIKQLSRIPNVVVKGLMTMPPLSDNPENSRSYFKQLKSLLNSINGAKIYPSTLTELSMGMSNDFEVAIEEGATIVRIGTAIFGERQ